jgi:hypothetical protein
MPSRREVVHRQAQSEQPNAEGGQGFGDMPYPPIQLFEWTNWSRTAQESREHPFGLLLRIAT